MKPLKTIIRELRGSNDDSNALSTAIFDAMESLVEDDQQNHLKTESPDQIITPAPFRNLSQEK